MEEPVEKIVGNRIYGGFGFVMRDRRKSAGYTHDDLARILGMRRSTVAGIESGRQRVLLADAVLIANVLEFSIDDLKSVFEVTSPTWAIDKRTSRALGILEGVMQEVEEDHGR